MPVPVRRPRLVRMIRFAVTVLVLVEPVEPVEPVDHAASIVAASCARARWYVDRTVPSFRPVTAAVSS